MLFIVTKFRAFLRLKEAIRQADEQYSLTGKRFYVIPNGNRGKLLIVDRPNFRLLKRKGYFADSVFVHDLERECFYCTPYKNGTRKLSKEIVYLKRQQYYAFIEYHLKGRLRRFFKKLFSLGTK